MILSAPRTIFFKCLYWKWSDTKIDNNCSKLVNNLFLSIIFHLITQNWIKTSKICILNISIPVPYSLSMPESAISIVGNLIALKTNSPVSELSSDIFTLRFFSSGHRLKLFSSVSFVHYVIVINMLQISITNAKI